MAEMSVSSQKDNDIHGYLRRAGQAGKNPRLRRKRFYKLHGAILSKQASEAADPNWNVNVQGADVVQLGKNHFALAFSREEKENVCKDPDQAAVVLCARTEEECDAWVAALKYAAHRKLENHYHLGDLIGEGGFAKVRLGRCNLTGALRAIKTMQRSAAHAKLFGTEIAVIKRVSHPNIVKTFDVYETTSEIHIVMEYMEGGMLYEAIQEGIRFEEDDVVQFMRELLDGILYLHRQGIVHRDMKPENVLCTSKEVPLHVKIADFGLSSITNVAELKANQMLMSTMIGTPEFVAPEIANREEYTEKVDIWALGMMCYNVICGKLPLDDQKDALAQLKDGLQLTFPEPEWNQYSDKAKSFIKALLCTAPERRPTALACLVHPWLDEKLPGSSPSVAQFGRVSKYLLDMAPHMSSLPSRRAMRIAYHAGTPRAVPLRSPQQVKKLWIIAYVAVAAANRFDWTVHPDRYERAAKMARLYARAQREAIPRWAGGQFELPASWGRARRRRGGNKGDDDGSSSERTALEKNAGYASLSDDHACERRASYTRDRSLSRKVSLKERRGSLSIPKKMRSWSRDHSTDAAKKSSLKEKLLSAFSGEAPRSRGPVRKLSRKLSKKSELNMEDSNSRSAQGSLDLDFGRKNATMQAVEAAEGDALSKGSEDRDLSGPASLLGKKHNLLLKKQLSKKQKDVEGAELSQFPQKT